MSRRRLRVLVLMHDELVPPDSIEGLSEQEVNRFRTEYDVCVTLGELGHEVFRLGVRSDLATIREGMESFRPHINFNLLESFHGVGVYDQHVVSYLELMRRRYTGCNPRGLMLAHDKGLSKQLLHYHRIPTPEFAVFRLGRKVRRPRRLDFPLMVKSLTEEGSLGIAQASVVTSDEQLIERVAFVHEQIGSDAIAEQFIPGRELYVGIVGNQRLETFPIWELLQTAAPDDPLIATSKVKWDVAYQKKKGIEYARAGGLDPALEARLVSICKRTYRVLDLSGYARIDLRLTPAGEPYVLEANPNPELSFGAEFAESAEAAGIEYPRLIQRILNLGLRHRAAWAD